MRTHSVFIVALALFVPLPCFADQDCNLLWQKAFDGDKKLVERLGGGPARCLAQGRVALTDACWSKQPRRGYDVPEIKAVADDYSSAISTCGDLPTLGLGNARFLVRVGEFCEAANAFAVTRSSELLAEEADAWLGCILRSAVSNEDEFNGNLLDALAALQSITGDGYEALRTDKAGRVLQNWISILTWRASRRSVVSSQAAYLVGFEETEPVWTSWALLLERTGNQWAVSAQTLLVPAHQVERVVAQLLLLNKKLSGN